MSEELPHQPRYGDGDGGLYVAGAGRWAKNWMLAPICFPLARSCTRWRREHLPFEAKRQPLFSMPFCTRSRPLRYDSIPICPRSLKRIINKCLEKDRELRYQHAADIRSDLKRLKRDTDSSHSRKVSEAPSAGPILVGPAADRPSSGAVILAEARRHKGVLALMLVGLAAADCWTGNLFVQAERTQE